MTGGDAAEQSLIDLPPLFGIPSETWPTLLELAERLDSSTWTLIGGQMVLLHGLGTGRYPARVSTDLDLLVNDRLVSVSPGHVAHVLLDMAFTANPESPEGLAHRFSRGDAVVDVLAPEGLGPRVDLTTVRPGRTIEVPGGSQALQRTEVVRVRFGDRIGDVPRPDLLGAIVIKACAADRTVRRRVHESDLAFLLSLVDDPEAMRGELSKKDRQRLRRRAQMQSGDHPAWQGIESSTDGRLALRILVRE